MSASPDPNTRQDSSSFQLSLRDGTAQAQSPDSALDPWLKDIASLVEQPPAWMDLQAAEVPQADLDRIPVGPTLVLGFGGSALGARSAMITAQRAGQLQHEVRILDTVDPQTVRDDLAWAAATGAKVQVISKSGRTDEVRALLEVVIRRGLGPHVFIADPGRKDFDERLSAAGIEVVRLEMPEAVGGRYSVFTAVGQAPLVAAGLPADALLRGARATVASLREGGAEAHALAALLAHRTAFPAGGHVVWCYSDALLSWGAWLQQLECESLGRATDEGRVGELVTVLRGPADQHSVAQLLLDGPQDKRVTIIDYADPGLGDADADLADLAALRAIERDAAFDAMSLPSARLLVRSRSLADLGAMMVHGLSWTVLLADHMGIDPYGQPAVEQIKRRVKAARTVDP